MSDPCSFRGKIALVTGASRGLGFALAREMAARGAHVLALARTTGGLEALDDAIRADSAQGTGGSATLVPLDLADTQGLVRLAERVARGWGRLDLLAHCAVHAGPLAPIAHADPELFDRTFAVGARGFFMLLRLFDPLLQASDDPRIVTFRDAQMGEGFFGLRRAAKAAEEAIARSYRAERGAEARGRLIIVEPPPMASASRARARPGERAEGKACARDVARALCDSLAQGAGGETLSLNV